MSRTESSYPTPVHGVSTLAPRNRAAGQAGIQTNLRSDPVAKLTRRPSLRWDAFLLNTDQNTLHHSYYRREQEFRIIVEQGGVVHGYVDNVAKAVTGNLSFYANTAEDLVVETINDTTFLVNPEKVVELLPATDATVVNKVSHINVTSALGYGEELTVTVTGPNIYKAFTYTIGTASDADTEDVRRRTNTVANAIRDGFTNVNEPTLKVAQKGSAVAFWLEGSSEWLTVTVAAGDGEDNVAVFNETTEEIGGLPLYAYPGARYTVKPDPASTEGTYYVEAIGLNGETDPIAYGHLQEVVWSEARSPTEKYAINANTMPHTIRYDYETETFIVGTAELGWDERLTGDDESCPPPVFIGRTITALGQFQKRLVLISDNDVEMTVTDNLFNWWKQSALDLLVTDPISITSNSTGIDILQYIIEHNRDLLIVASNGQFKIDGTSGVTPQTVAMPLTTAQEIQISVPPLSLGSSIYMPINYGESTGITEYSGSRDQQDLATPQTHHVIGYMKGEAKLLVGSPNLEMLAMTTTESLQNEIFIYEQFSIDGKKQQQSWSTWTLPADNEILHLEFRRDRLSITVKVGDNIYLKQIDMYSRVAINTDNVFLDDFLTLTSTDGFTVTLPDGYPQDAIMVGADNCQYELFKLPHTKAGNTVTFTQNISKTLPCKVYAGTPFRSEYQPTRPFRLDKEGIAITTDRLRVQRWILNVVDTERITMEIKSLYNTFEDQTVTNRRVSGLGNRLGVMDLFTGDMQFSYSQNAEHADALFFTEGFLGMTIAGISWQGQYYQTSGRI